MSRRTVVYISCPMRLGNWTKNVRTAARVQCDLMRKGYSVINPIGSWLTDIVEPLDFETWINNDYGLIDVSDAIIRIPGESEGADLECDYAIRQDKELFWDLRELYGELPTTITINEI